MYTGMTKEQIKKIKELVDRDGWDAVHNHPELSLVLKNLGKNHTSG